MKYFQVQLQHELGKAETFTFVKVGANDGLTGDPCSHLIRLNTNTRGLLIEPVPYLAKQLKQNFSTGNFTVIQAAIGASHGSREFFFVGPNARLENSDFPEWCEQLGSFSRDHILKQLNGKLERYIESIQVPVIPLSNLLDEYFFDSISLLHIDVEGFDFEVLQTLDFAKSLPRLIFVEQKHLSSEKLLEMRSLLKYWDYQLRDCGDDLFARL